MKRNSIEYIRNVGIIAHIDAGKTTVSERILYYTGKSHKLGEVHEGKAIMDWMVDEQERGITITSAVTSCSWGKNNIQLIDTPGHVDFTVEVERSLRVLDGAVGVFCAVGGVEPQSEMVWRQADKYCIPKIAFINKLDRVGSNFLDAVSNIKKRLNVKPLIIQIPVGTSDNFSGIIDLIKMEQIEWDKNSLGVKYKKKRIDQKMKDVAKLHREELIEVLAEQNDEIMEFYLNDSEISTETLIKAIRKATIDLDVVPILCGAALKNKGIQPLIDAIVDFLPSPLDIPPMHATDPVSGNTINCEAKESTPLAALIFKVSLIEGRKLSFVRIYSGKIVAGSYVYNSSKNKIEKLSRVLILHANRKERINEAGPGSIVGIIGLKNSTTGETLCNENNKLLLEKIDYEKPVISVALEPNSQSALEKLRDVLSKFMMEDPTLEVREDIDTGQILLSGMGELHLEIVLSRMRREFDIEVKVGKPQVVYRETIRKSYESKIIFDKEISGHRHYAEVSIRLEPQSRGEGNVFSSNLSNKSVPHEIISSIEESVTEALKSGVILGYPVIDVKSILIDVSIPESDSKILAYKIAASIASRQALERSNPCLLDPIMEIEILVPKNFIGEVIRDINSRKGKIKSIEELNESQTIKASIPLALTFGYSTTLRSLTQGKGTFTMNFSKFDLKN